MFMRTFDSFLGAKRKVGEKDGQIPVHYVTVLPCRYINGERQLKESEKTVPRATWCVQWGFCRVSDSRRRMRRGLVSETSTHVYTIEIFTGEFFWQESGGEV